MKDAAPKPQLTLFDCTCIIVGIIIGAGIFEATPNIARSVASPLMLLAAFALGGVISLIGALCYAELATAYPREGGDYVFLTRAYGRRTGFLFAWSEFWVVRPGNIGAMAYVFARYAAELYPLPGVPSSLMAYAMIAVLALTGVNALGVEPGKWTQNVLTTIKVVGLLAVFATGLMIVFSRGMPAAAAQPASESGFRLAMILVLFTYGGWNEMSYVAAEVRDPRRNILRALLCGTLAVTIVYLLVNVAFVGSLGFQGVRNADALASQVLEIPFGSWGGKAIALLICISCLGSVNGMVLTGSRVYYALGTEHRFYAFLGRWNRRLQSPVRSLLVQGMVTLLLVAFFGMGQRSFERLVVFTSPFFWLFFFFVGAGLFLLRSKDRDVERPFRVPLFPLTPLLFCLSTLFMLYSAVSYAGGQSVGPLPWYLHFESLWPVGIMLLGLLASLWDPPIKDGR